MNSDYRMKIDAPKQNVCAVCCEPYKSWMLTSRNIYPYNQRCQTHYLAKAIVPFPVQVLMYETDR